MALRGIKPDEISKRLKALVYGAAGTGKTTMCIHFPRPYLIDTERGAENPQYVRALKESGGAYFFTTDPDDLIAEVLALLTETHSYQTVIIDPLTVIYADLLDKAASKVGTEFGRHKMPADRKIKHLLTLLLRLDMNVVVTSHSKPKWVRAKNSKGQDTVAEEGETFDCYGRMDYLFDLVFEVQKRGLDRVGIVRKTRVEAFPDGYVFPFSYQELASRYGRGIMEKESVPEDLATHAQVAKLEELLSGHSDGEAMRCKWLEKARAETLYEMPASAMTKCIAFLASRRDAVPSQSGKGD